MRSLIAAFAALLLGATLATPPASAQDDAFEARRVVAAEYRELFLESTDLGAMAMPAAQPMLAQIAAQQPDLWAEKEVRITGIVIDFLVGNIESSMVEMDAQMARVFTMEELVALRDFYASPEGRSVMGKMPAFMQEVMPGIMQDAFGNVQGLLAELEAEGVNVR